MRRMWAASPLSLSRPSRLLLSKLPSPATSISFSSSSSILTPGDLEEIETLSRRLCDAGRLREAVRLLDASILAASSSELLGRLPVPFLVDRLSSQADMAPAMSLLTSLRHNPNHSLSLPYCSKLLLSSYLSKRRYKEAWKLLSWFLRDGAPCRPDEEMYRLAVRGFCGGGRALGGVRAVREMVRDGFQVRGDDELRGLLWQSMLREARIDDAKEIDAAITRTEAGGGEDAADIGEILDRIIRDWEE